MSHPLEGKKFPHWKYLDRVAGEWIEKNTRDFVGPSSKSANVQDRQEWKKGIIFGLPGAFTPTCSTQQLPNFELLYDEFRDLGVDYIGCMSVNDPFVMNAWFKEQKIKNVMPIPDGNFVGTETLGMRVSKSNLNFGERCWRFVILIDRGFIAKVFEEPGKENDHSEDPYTVTQPEKVLAWIKENGIQFDTVNNVEGAVVDDWGQAARGYTDDDVPKNF